MLFPVNEVNRIIEISSGGTKDRFIWAKSKHDSYYVRSGYKMVAK